VAAEDALGDVETEPHAFSMFGLTAFIEALEDERNLFFRNANALVLNSDEKRGLDSAENDGDGRVGRGIFVSIV